MKTSPAPYWAITLTPNYAKALGRNTSKATNPNFKPAEAAGQASRTLLYISLHRSGVYRGSECCCMCLDVHVPVFGGLQEGK